MTGSSTEKCVRTTLCTLCDAPDDDMDIDVQKTGWSFSVRWWRRGSLDRWDTVSSQFETFLLLLLLWTIWRSTWTRTVCREGRLLNGVEVLKQGHTSVMVVVVQEQKV